MPPKICPLCKKTLTLQQVNFDLAVYLCEDLKCQYPVGYNCVVVDRKLEDINKDVTVLAEPDGALDDWVDKVTCKETPQAVPSVTIDLEQSEESSDEPSEWINDLVEEAVNEARRYKDSEPVENNASASLDTDFDEILNFIST